MAAFFEGKEIQPDKPSILGLLMSVKQGSSADDPPPTRS